MAYKIEELRLENFGMMGDFYCNQFSNINYQNHQKFVYI